jgi:5-formyltetrahydrofolate cyclo-ligase
MVTGLDAQTKAQLRIELLAARRAIPLELRSAEALRLAEHLSQVVGPNDTVCGYVPIRTEPGSMLLVDRLFELCARLLLPVTRTETDGSALALQWAEYRPGALLAGPYGLLEPAQPWLAASTIVDATVLLVPALAVDRHGVRLGRGGGFYDRSLRLRRHDAKLVAVVRDDEVLDKLPYEAHDVRMTHALTPERGVIALCGADPRGA